MRREGKVYIRESLAGLVWQDENGYGFQYDTDYLNQNTAEPVSLTLPLTPDSYLSKTMIPFFDALIPEGWLLDITVQNWKLANRDRMGLLLVACRDCIGVVSIIGPDQNEKEQ
jgi:serine/threonine-protein kinase HipA